MAWANVHARVIELERPRVYGQRIERVIAAADDMVAGMLAGPPD